MLPGTVGHRLAALPVPLLVAAGAVAAVALLGSIGTAQWLVLRRAGVGGPSWIGATAGAWTAGLAVFLASAMPLWRPGQPWWLITVIGLACGALMAATVAGLTGLAAVRLSSVEVPERTRGPVNV